ncbi:hypothetical protein QBC46DRAFT_409938 [Diplogelasinospora grovesii]|uniref:Uncharacterized protein n=1 Tax=Diplogelasinospora grovesii TaxID=303347 RepID=A0AAN6S3J3_9PEZI|nr:hypothetical protein QBC46DRAFT_409938 [Diplogelasinospora grovesii]
MQPTTFLATAILLFSAGALAAPATDSVESTEISGVVSNSPTLSQHCVPNDHHGNCLVADHGKTKTIQCSPDHPATGETNMVHYYISARGMSTAAIAIGLADLLSARSR